MIGIGSVGEHACPNILYARLALKDLPNKPLCDIVVLHWSDGVMLWQSVQGRDKSVSVPLDQVDTLDWGSALDVLSSLPAASLPGAVPDCSSDFPG